MQGGAALELSGLESWLVARGLRGLPLEEQLDGFCRRLFDAGFPMKRVQTGLGTLHPRYGAQTYVWRPGAGIEQRSWDRSLPSRELYLRSPVYHMQSRGLTALRCRIDREIPEDFTLFPELRAEGLTDYAAFAVPYAPLEEQVSASANATAAALGPDPEGLIDGIYFSCATDRPEGFDQGQLDRVAALLPFLALALKSRLTYDVAHTVIGTYLGQDAGRRVLTGQIERGSAETIRAVIWFADLRGFTRLADSLPRDELVAALDDYLEYLAAPLEARGGQILKFLGDGLLAVFDLTHRDDVEVCGQALAAASALRDALPAFNAARAAEGKPVMQFSLALHLGEVLYGNIGASERLDFTVIGPAVNETSRIQALCRPLDRQVLISSSFQSVAAALDLEPLGTHSLRGVQRPQPLFTLPG